jgi:hypothetical protein
MKFCAGLLLVLVSGCADNTSALTEAGSQQVFTAANSQLHDLHIAALALDVWPQQFTWDCEDGGSVSMTTTERDDGSILNLEHSLDQCTAQGRTFSGPLNYNDFGALDCDGREGFAYIVVGDLAVSGTEEGDCQMRAVESCGKITGTTCGYDI